MLDGFEVSWLCKSAIAFGDVRRRKRPADPPAGHRVGLAHAVDDQVRSCRPGRTVGEAGEA